jgi:dTDP-4-amino-4,6-dideoxygalactose transaminase
MLDVEAAVGLEQLAKYPKIIEHRRERAKNYDENLLRRDGWVFPPIVDGATYSHYVVRVPERKRVINEWASKGVQLGDLIQYTIPLLPGYRINKLSGCDSSEIASHHTINFPVSK